jgi:TRAP-type C4-dicarboxylate transport system permease small subunit
MVAALRLLSPVNDWLARLIAFVSSVIVLIIVVVVFAGVALRFLTGQGHATMQELPPLLMPWLIFPLLGVLLRSESHITVDFLPAILSERPRRFLRVAVAFVALVGGAIFCQAGLEAVELFRLTGQVTEMELEFPIWWVYVSFPVGFAILLSFALEIVLRAITDTPRESASAHGAEL